MRGNIEDNLKDLFFSFLNKNIRCDPSLEPSQHDDSNDVSQHIFKGVSWEFILYPYLEHC